MKPSYRKSDFWSGLYRFDKLTTSLFKATALQPRMERGSAKPSLERASRAREKEEAAGVSPLNFTASKLAMRRGVSGIAAVLIAAGFFVASISFLSLKFNQSGLFNSPKSFLEKTSALISKTFGDMLSPVRDMPATEINLGEEKSANVGENKNSAIAKSFLSAEPGAAEKKSTEKISEHKKDSSAKLFTARSNAGKNNFSLNSSSDIESPVVDNLEISKSLLPALCRFTKTQAPNHKILFSEVAWMGSAKSASDEWIELKNNSGQDLPLRGWQILSDDKNIKIVFDEKNNFPAGAFYLLERSDDNSAPSVPADKIYTGALSNDGVRLGIFNPDCELVDEIDASKAWPAGDNAAKKTMERSFLDLSWHTSANAGGTPKAENSAAFLAGQSLYGSIESPQSGSADSTSAATGSVSQNGTTSSNTGVNAPAAVSHILISDIQTTGGSGKSDNDVIKLYNAGDSAVDVSGWQLKKKTQSGNESSVKVFPSGSSIASRGYFVWANSGNNFAVSVNANVSSTAYLSDNYSIALFDSSGKIIDAVAWGSGHTNPFVESSAYPTNPAANQILGRKIVNAAMQDTQNNQEDFEIK